MASIVPIRDQFVVSMGELLWDVMGNQRFVGGAPFNFAYHCRQMGVRSSIVSCISHDDLGADLVARAEALEVGMEGIRRCVDYSTGIATARVLEDGGVEYDLPEECAWDHLRFGDRERELVEQATILNFGTLAQRNKVSRSAIMAAVANAPMRACLFLDLNLRAPYYSREMVTASLNAAEVVKMNVDELEILRGMYGLGERDEDAVRQLMDKFDLATVVLTRGKEGASAWSGDEAAHVAGYRIDVADSVGCGDAFAAAFVVRLMSGMTLTDSLEAANLTGAFVATQGGGTPSYTREILREFHLDHYRAQGASGGVYLRSS